MFHRPNTPNQPNQTQPTQQPPSQPTSASPAPATQTTTAPSTQGESQTMSQTPTTPEAANADAQRSADIPAGNPFQRPNQPAAPAAAAPGAARPAGAPAYNAYPAYGAPAASMPGSSSMSSMSSTAGDSKRRLLIGEGITLSGEIESCDHLLVEGTVEAALKGANVLEIAEKGMFYGTVEINEATIAGKFEGDITVNGRLTVRGTGSVTGAISYKDLVIESGAVLDGKLSPLGGKGASSEKKSPRAAAVKPQEELPILQRASAQ